jgi:DNA replication protein DnaC
MAAALLHYGMMNFKSCRAWPEKRLFSALREHIGEGVGGDYASKLKMLTDDDFVILDDLGSSKSTEWRVDIIFDFVDQRFSNGKPTYISTNLSPQEIKEVYGPRTHSRLFAARNTILYLPDAPDLRQETLD